MIQDLETEKSVLAAIFQHGKDGLIDVSDIISGETFKDQTHQVIFACASKALEKSDLLDLPLFLSAAHELGLDGVVKEQGELISELRERKTELAHLRLLGKKIAKLHLMRTAQAKLRTAMSELDRLTGEETTNQILSIIENPAYQIQSILNSCDESGQLIAGDIEEYIENLIKNPNIEVGIPTGMKYFDKAIGGGLRRGGYTLMAARPKAGKSSTALNTALYIAEKIKIPVLYLDTEMIPREHQPRILANKTSIPIETIEKSRFTSNPSWVRQIREAGKKTKNLPITHEKVSGKDFEEILSIARRWVVKKVGYNDAGKTNNCVIVYDYFKLMNAKELKSLKEYEAIGYMATKLSEFCRAMDVACFAFVQLNKESDIAQSDRLVWYAIAVGLLMEKTQEEIVMDGYENGNRKIVMPGNYVRFGGGLDPSDYINLEFNKECCQMVELGTAIQARADKQIGKAGFKIKEENDE